MSCSSLQINFEKELKFNGADEATAVDMRGMDLNQKFLKKILEKKVIKVVGDFRGWDKIFRRIPLPPTYPPDIIVSDPEGEVIESYTFNTPLTYEIEKEMTFQDIYNGCKSNASSLEDLTGETKSVDDPNSFNDYESNASSLEDLTCETKIVDDSNETGHAESKTNTKKMYGLGISKQFLKLHQKKLKRLCTECKEVKFVKGKLKACNEAKLAKNELWKNEIAILKSTGAITKISKKCVADAFKKQVTVIEDKPKHLPTVLEDKSIKELQTLIEDTSKDYQTTLMVDTSKEQATLMQEFLELKKSSEQMLEQSRVDIEQKRKAVERKIGKIERKLKQAWRFFGKRKLRVTLAKYEYMRGNYDAMVYDITAKLESEITSIMQLPIQHPEERLI